MRSLIDLALLFSHKVLLSTIEFLSTFSPIKKQGATTKIEFFFFWLMALISVPKQLAVGETFFFFWQDRRGKSPAVLLLWRLIWSSPFWPARDLISPLVTRRPMCFAPTCFCSEISGQL